MIDYGHGVTLRRIDELDLDRLFAWRNDFRVWKWCRQNEPLHWSAHLKWFDWQATNKTVSMFSIVDPSVGLVGVCGLTDIDPINRRAEFSLYIDPEQAGRGLGTSAIRTLFRHGFERLGLNVIWGETFHGNKAGNMFASVGMTVEGCRRDFYFRDGKFIDAWLYSIRWDELK